MRKYSLNFTTIIVNSAFACSVSGLPFSVTEPWFAYGGLLYLSDGVDTNSYVNDWHMIQVKPDSKESLQRQQKAVSSPGVVKL